MKTPPWNVSKNAQTNAQINHLVIVQGHCFFAWVKLLDVIRFLHPLAMVRNQQGRHGTTEVFHALVLTADTISQSEMET